MNPCKCGSYAINPSMHGRDGTDLESCDVCFWRNRAGAYELALRSILAEVDAWLHDDKMAQITITAIALAAEKDLKR